jgi:glycogen debranching enzyme
MNYRKITLFLLIVLSVITQEIYSQKPDSGSIDSLFNTCESIRGRSQYLQSPCAATGDRLYMIGFQDGTFPDLGWHVAGEMGGIWHHPIKLMDGFEVSLKMDGVTTKLDKADAFVNYPVGNKIIYNTLSEQVSVERLQFVPDGENAAYLEFAIQNKTGEKLKIDLDLKAISNLRPVWLGERTGMIDGKDKSTYDPKDNFWIAKDSLNPWYVVYGSLIKGKPERTIESKSGKPNVSVTNTVYSFEIAPNAVYRFPLIISGSSKSETEAIESFRKVGGNALSLISQKKERFMKINQKSNITLSDKELETTFRWIKYNTEWLVADIEGMGRGVCAGLPDYPWWFGGDMDYTLKGLIASGQKDLVYSTIELLYNISEKTNGNGRIVHEVSTNGAVYNPGNVNETPQFISLIWDVFCWTGDKDFLEKYFPEVEKGLAWLKGNDKDGNFLPDGFGMMEVHGLNSEMIDVAVYSQKAFADASQMAAVSGNKKLADEYQKTAEIIKSKINSDFWVEDFGSYADFIGTKEQALRLVKDALIRADTLKKPWAEAELKNTQAKIETYDSDIKKGFVMHHNWVVNTPMETGIADKEKAVIALETAEKFTSSFGMFVTGIDRDESAGADEGSFAAEANKRAFTYTGAVMTLPTGVQVVSENNYGRPDKAYALLKKMVKTFSYALPGSIYEVSPDFGMMTQAWNMYAFGEPLIKQLFGIRPFAYKKEIFLSPLLPSALTDGKIENVETGDNEISVAFIQNATGGSFEIKQKSEDWKIIFSQPAGKYKKWVLNGKPVMPEAVGDKEQISVKGGMINIVLEKIAHR